MRDARIAVTDLMLDTANPRHVAVDGQREAIEALLADASEKLVTLARDIAENGLSPMDLLLVMPDENNLFTVLEGNRRVACLKLLVNPSLAEGFVVEREFRALSSQGQPPEEVRCSIVSSREEARRWLELRHTGERNGAGVVRWGAEAQERFARTRGSHADRALSFSDAVSGAFRSNRALQGDIEAVRKTKLTTLGRLVSDPYVREVIGANISRGDVQFHYDANNVLPVIERMFADLAGKLTVTSLKSKAQRREYVDGLRKLIPDEATYHSDPSSLNQETRRSRKPKKKSKKAKAEAVPKTLLGDVQLQNLGSKVAAILCELKMLDVDNFPNAGAVLLRSVIELSISQVYAKKHWKEQGELKKRVRKCLNEIDPNGKATEYQAVRTGLDDGTSVLAVATLHGYVHNPHFHPSGTELRTIATNYSQFINALDGMV